MRNPKAASSPARASGGNSSLEATGRTPRSNCSQYRGGVGNVDGAAAAGIARRARPQAVERAAPPIVDIVAAGPFRQFAPPAVPPREVGHFVLLEARRVRRRQEFVIHRAGQIFVGRDFAGPQLGEQRACPPRRSPRSKPGVRCPGRRPPQGGAPCGHRLARNGEHQIQVHVVESGGPEEIERLENHLAAVNPAQPLQQGRRRRTARPSRRGSRPSRAAAGPCPPRRWRDCIPQSIPPRRADSRRSIALKMASHCRRFRSDGVPPPKKTVCGFNSAATISISAINACT